MVRNERKGSEWASQYIRPAGITWKDRSHPLGGIGGGELGWVLPAMG